MLSSPLRPAQTKMPGDRKEYQKVPRFLHLYSTTNQSQWGVLKKQLWVAKVSVRERDTVTAGVTQKRDTKTATNNSKGLIWKVNFAIRAKLWLGNSTQSTIVPMGTIPSNLQPTSKPRGFAIGGKKVEVTEF